MRGETNTGYRDWMSACGLAGLMLMLSASGVEAQAYCAGPWTDTNDGHVASGRAYEQPTTDCSACYFGACGWPAGCEVTTTDYFTIGADEALGSDGSATSTLYESPAGTFSTTACSTPAGAVRTMPGNAARMTAPHVGLDCFRPSSTGSMHNHCGQSLQVVFPLVLDTFGLKTVRVYGWNGNGDFRCRFWTHARPGDPGGTLTDLVSLGSDEYITLEAEVPANGYATVHCFAPDEGGLTMLQYNP